MTVKEAAIRLEVSQGTVYALISGGKLRCYRIGNGRGAIRISDEHLAEFLRAAEPAPVTPPEPPAPPLRLKHLRLPKAVS